MNLISEDVTVNGTVLSFGAEIRTDVMVWFLGSRCSNCLSPSQQAIRLTLLEYLNLNLNLNQKSLVVWIHVNVLNDFVAF